MLYFFSFCLGGDRDQELESPEYLDEEGEFHVPVRGAENFLDPVQREEEEGELHVPLRQLPQPHLISRRIGLQLDTEHVHLRKCCVDDMSLCDGCAVRYCRENRIEYYLLFTEHNIMNPIQAGGNYVVEKCHICQIGMMSVFGARGCPSCRCMACNRIPAGMGCCENCQRVTLLFGCVIRRMKVP